MDDSRATRLVGIALRCYPARWRRRHGQDAAELAALLIRDGIRPASVACSYLAGAVREWLSPRLGRHMTVVACALLAAVCSLGVTAGVVASAGSARAASTSQAHRHARCRPGPAEAVAPTVGRLQLILGEAWHGRHC